MSFFRPEIILSLVHISNASANESVDIVNAGSIWQMLGSLLLVLALIFFLAWFVRKAPLSISNSRGAIRIISSVALGSRERATLVEVEGKRLLLGVAQGGVTLLQICETTDDSVADNDHSINNSESESSARGFRQLFNATSSQSE